MHALAGGGRVKLDAAGGDGLDGFGDLVEVPFSLSLSLGLPLRIPVSRVDLDAVSEVSWSDWSGDGDGSGGFPLLAPGRSRVAQVGGRGSGDAEGCGFPSAPTVRDWSVAHEGGAGLVDAGSKV